ncbi:MAG: PD-(D/E)XK nuclease-like domain-containing protein [gamma proteobacterium symbiont of Taylorina sp.]|nr:PD-(D/E)XK nuclease-like domain-containing protein [gamma proteobacterium symbiont of Taylorina sp.]
MSNTSQQPNLSNADYHAESAYGSTSVKQAEVPAVLQYHQNNPQEYKDCFRIGSLIHTCILEPEKLNEEYLTAPNIGKRSKADRESWADWFLEHGANDVPEIITKPAANWYGEFQKQTGISIVTPDELSKFMQMLHSVQSNSEAVSLLSGGRAEQSLFFTDDETGVNLKVRPDQLNDQFCTDIKSTRNAKPHAFARSIMDFGYHISQAMYLDGIKQVTGRDVQYRYIVIQKDAPYLCVVYQLSDESAEIGRVKYRELLRKLAECLESDQWPGLENNFDLSLPAWALDDGEQITFEGVTL